MSVTNAIWTHSDALFSVASAQVSGAISDYPKRYLKDELGRKLVEDVHKAVDDAALAEDFSDLDQ